MRHELSFWRPRDLILAAVQQPLDAFAAACGSPYLLVVMLDAPQSELADGLLTLNTSDSAARREQDATITIERDSVASPGPPQRPSASRSWDELAQRLQRPAEQVPAEFRRALCHVLPVRKRPAGESITQHVSIGRARNHDIVLRHPSVSKFHAWLETHEAPPLFVKDIGSQNHTFIDSRQSDGRIQLSPGQTVRFGSVECLLCTPEGLRNALHA